MKPITQKSTDKTIEAARRVQMHLEASFKLPFGRAYKMQGSVMCHTHIKASDFDFLTIIDQYYYIEPGIPNPNPYTGIPSSDIAMLRKQAVEILKDIYDEVDNSHDKCISIY